MNYDHLVKLAILRFSKFDSLQDGLDVSTPTVQTLVQPHRKVSDNLSTHFLGNSSDKRSDGILHTYIYPGVIGLPVYLKKKSSGFRSGECGAHGCSVLQEVTRSVNFSANNSNLAFAEWGVAPSCIIHCLSCCDTIFAIVVELTSLDFVFSLSKCFSTDQNLANKF